MNDDFFGILAEEFAGDPWVGSGDIQFQLLADDANPGLRNNQVNAGHFGTRIESREQPLSVDRTARSGDAYGDGFHLLISPRYQCCWRFGLIGNYIGRRKSLSSK